MSTAASTPRAAGHAGARGSSAPATGAVQSIDPVKLLRKYAFLLILSTLLGAAIGVGAYVLLAKFLPRYDAKAIFQVHAPVTESTAALIDSDQEKEPLERFMSTQTRIMTSEKVYERVFNDPRFRQEAPTWYQEHTDRTGQLNHTNAVEKLQDTVSARPIPKSELIQLTVSYSKASEAAAIAQRITAAYLHELGAERTNLRAETRESIANRIKETEDEIERKERARDRLITENEIQSLDTRESEEQMAMNQLVASRASVQQTITSLTTQQEDFERILSSPGGIVYPDEIRSMVEQDPLILNAKNTLQNLRASDRALEKQEFGINHPARSRVRSEIDAVSEQMEQERERLMAEQFGNQLDAIRRGLLQLRAQEASILREMEEVADRLSDLAKLSQEIKQFDREIENLTERLADDEEALDNLNAIAERRSSDRVVPYEPARIPGRMAFPRPEIIIPAGAVLVLGLTSGLIVLREVLDQRIKGPADVAMIPRTPVLGMVPIASEDPSRPERAETAFHDRPTGVIAESIRQLRVAAFKKMHQAGHRSLLVVPATPGAGATTVVTNLAEACSRADLKTLILDANLRRPRIHTLFNLEPNPGLSDVLAGACELEQAVCRTDNENLDVMTVGSGEHRMFERIATDTMGELMTRLEAKYDIVLVDVAPAIVAGDAVGLANRCGATILVARALAEKRGTIARLKNELSDTRAEFLGVLINAVRPAAGGYFRRNMRASHEYQHKGRKSA